MSFSSAKSKTSVADPTNNNPGDALFGFREKVERRAPTCRGLCLSRGHVNG